MFDITIATCTDCGQRDANEDALRTGQAGTAWYAVLSDGAGGHERGAEASRRVVDHMDVVLSESPFAPRHLTQAVLSAHAELQREQMGVQGVQRMHATVVALWVDGHGDRAVWSHVGDSRLYRLRYGAIDAMTTDDSVVQRMLESGALTPLQARSHPMKNQLLAALGMQDSVEPHTPAETIALEDGDAFLLCTDGWWAMLEDADMVRTLSDTETPQAWLDAMSNLIRARHDPEQDNFSAIAVWVSDPSESTRSMPDADESTVSMRL